MRNIFKSKVRVDVDVLFDLYKDLDRRIVDLDNFYFEKEKTIASQLEEFSKKIEAHTKTMIEWAHMIDKKLQEGKKCSRKKS